MSGAPRQIGWKLVGPSRRHMLLDAATALAWELNEPGIRNAVLGDAQVMADTFGHKLFICVDLDSVDLVVEPYRGERVSP